MKQFVCGIAALALMVLSPVKAQDFAWKHGTNQTAQGGVYGNVGVPAPGNMPGGRSGQVCWRDLSGDFWMFGGEGYDFTANFGLLGDLWKYQPASNNWTWIKGNNVISQIGVYGTQGTSTAGNRPSSRTGAANWMDASGNFWLFGGYGWDGGSSIGYLNDLWKYNVGNNEWTWMNGSNIANPSANYGTIGVPSSSNVPGPRNGAATWTDSNGNFYLFGGYGTATATAMGSLNDLWQYNPNTNTWTWIKGSNTTDQNGNYGTINVSASSNQPGARAFASTWKDATGGFWMMAGDGFDQSIPFKNVLNDLWFYDVPTNQWIWKGGTNLLQQTGIYGTQGVASATNMPDGRKGAITWRDAVNNFWLFSGEGLAATNVAIGQLNDLWKYNPTTSEWMWVKGTSAIDQAGTYGSLNVPALGNRPGGRNGACSWIDANNNLFLFGGAGYATTTTSGKLNDLWKYTNCYISPITMTITARDSLICAGESTSLTVVGSNNYVWSSDNSTAPTIVITPNATTTYTVYTSDGNGCTYSAVFQELVDPCLSLANRTASSFFSVYPQPAHEAITLKVPADYAEALFLIRNLSGQVIYQAVLQEGTSKMMFNLEAGLYFYEVQKGSRTLTSGKLMSE